MVSQRSLPYYCLFHCFTYVATYAQVDTYVGTYVRTNIFLQMNTSLTKIAYQMKILFSEYILTLGDAEVQLTCSHVLVK